jgi:gamma-glutamylcyclotransferase (GGCT)/AIG2-like uncharacterized protein YtfP
MAFIVAMARMDAQRDQMSSDPIRVAAAAERRLPFFFYGTLKPGGVNYLRYHLAEALVGEVPATLDRAALYTDGTYPVVLLLSDARPSDQVQGFLMTLADAVYTRLLSELDDLEEYHPNAPLEQSWFVRRVTAVRLASGAQVEAWMYEAGPRVAAQIAAGELTRIDSGDWPITGLPLAQ